jgi:spore coat polysaccharide biosynthesis protein SpsF (cytidylyltransferase family)
MEKLLSVDDIQCVNFRFKTDNLYAFEFETKESVTDEGYIEEESLFRLEYFLKDGQFVKRGDIFIAVAYSEDYDVMEEVTFLFDEDALFEYFKKLDEENKLDDHTEQYLEHIGESE